MPNDKLRDPDDPEHPDFDAERALYVYGGLFYFCLPITFHDRLQILYFCLIAYLSAELN